MKRFGIVFLLAGIAVVPAWGQTAEQKKATIAYVQSLQQPDGGFRAAATPGAAAPSSLRATALALRALKYFGGEPKDRAATARFVEKCHDKASGGFADHPGGKPDVLSTAIGILAVVETKLPAERYSAGAIQYLADNARSFEDIRIAVAGLESLGKPSPKVDEWRKQVTALLNPDGTAGKGDGAARETGSVLVALLRMGTEIKHKEGVLKALKAGQRSDGGFGKADTKGSDLESSYRVMRCFHMLKEKPDADRLRAFVAKCRNADGGYGIAPGQPSTVSGTYFASIILHWLEEK